VALQSSKADAKGQGDTPSLPMALSSSARRHSISAVFLFSLHWREELLSWQSSISPSFVVFSKELAAECGGARSVFTSSSKRGEDGGAGEGESEGGVSM
jgi:hypothetical protein